MENTYKKVVTVATIVSFAVPYLGVEALSTSPVPVLTAVVPIVICLILFSIFDKRSSTAGAVIGGVIGAGIVSILDIAAAQYLDARQEAKAAGDLSLKKKWRTYRRNLLFEWLVSRTRVRRNQRSSR